MNAKEEGWTGRRTIEGKASSEKRKVKVGGRGTIVQVEWKDGGSNSSGGGGGSVVVVKSQRKPVVVVLGSKRKGNTEDLLPS